ncbi:hypothetical protein MKEN_00616000 [Mycena kentingensis (nom. inval.)]|nr:hypothetical protein MKEN_00616000 [Mycena kentingensis (nom. inval.)]
MSLICMREVFKQVTARRRAKFATRNPLSSIWTLGKQKTRREGTKGTAASVWLRDAAPAPLPPPATMLALLVLLVFAGLSTAAAGILTNTSIDDTSPLIVYGGSWEASSAHTSGLDFGGSHTMSSHADASAVLRFKGVAVHYIAPRWPYAVRTKLTLDANLPVVVDLTDPTASPTEPGGSESALASIVWSATGLVDAEHILVVSMDMSVEKGRFVIVDGFIVTSVESEDTQAQDIPTTSDTSPSASPSPPTAPTSASANAASTDAAALVSNPQILGAIITGSIGATIFIGLGIWFLRRRFFPSSGRQRSSRTSLGSNKSNVLPEWGRERVPVPASGFRTLRLSEASTSTRSQETKSGSSSLTTPTAEGKISAAGQGENAGASADTDTATLPMLGRDAKRTTTPPSPPGGSTTRAATFKALARAPKSPVTEEGKVASPKRVPVPPLQLVVANPPPYVEDETEKTEHAV